MADKFRPTCRLCGKAHFGFEPHVWPDEPAVSSPVNKPANKSQPVNNEVNKLKARIHELEILLAERDAEIAKLTQPPKRSDDAAKHRRAYMREYMRRKRNG